ncbi:bifunctional diguanylate cyclase/phosphodiesterase [Roseomonas sp. PWR1]|uniref:Bifunctional diguanylate cyclase/phosphodiesterase n=1 Tax=Roseomonas nitratireducens TaxID=2820810 RepID=A0ABS4APY9_9PROT|nr:bifunctional diguanylate cyclase/phosphodiesterase [Neoroseomonas nitratireducens]MBP0462928.1 bifunctional diguanylate cyclase/phosphodiesterase [Neoroseomonas nitratireducens]
MADADIGRRPLGGPSSPLPDGLLSFDADLRIGHVSPRAAVQLGLARVRRTHAGLSDLLEASPRLDRDAVASLVAAAVSRVSTQEQDIVAEAPDGAAEPLRLAGAPGLRFAFARTGASDWILAIEEESGLPGGGGADHVTGLADRAMFEARLGAALDRPPRRRAGLAVLICDIDGIRAVNQVLGHAVGEDLLRAAGRRLRAALRESDLVARLAGEEFAILQADVADATQAQALSARLVDLLARPYLIAGETVTVTPRIGFAIAPADGAEAGLLIRRAGLARTEASPAGGWLRFAPEMDARFRELRAMESALRRAVESEQFELHFQPQVALPEGRLTGFEALIRWRHPERGLVPPIEFLPIAERLGLMGRIGTWVLREACRVAAGWPAGLRVAVNIAPAQFDRDGLPPAVEAALAASGLAAERLEVEVTENVLLAAQDTALDQLRALRGIGVHIAMDDFGTGYSSLTQLRIFPFDRLKIDRSFVRDLCAGGDAAAIVRAVAGLGRSLGICVTAEGVETQAQLDGLRAEGCDAAQGYLFGRPVPAGDLPDVISTFAPASAG